MRNKTLALVAAAFIAGAASLSAVNPKPFTVPEVREWKGADGSWSLNGAKAIVYTNPALKPVAEQLAANLQALGLKALPVKEQRKGGNGDIILSLKPSRKAKAESYTIDVNKKGVAITAPTAEGARWGAMTLTQMADAAPEIPMGHIADAPAYGYRGFMIDAGRKYIPIDYLYRLVDVMAYYKMNELHIHLNDNGFPRFFQNDWEKTQAAHRLESETYPGLAAQDGHYTKAEFRALQDYAAERGVNIIPEIDVPAHSLAYTLYNPELASHGANGMDHFDISKPETYEFIDALLAEYLEGPDPVFKGKVFHIGTDEYQGDSLAMEQFRAFTDHYIKFAEKYGKKAAIWGSLTHAKGQTPVKVDDVLMYLWSNGYAKPEDMIAAGYEVMSIPDGYVYIVPAAGYYYDYLNTKMLYDSWTPANIGGYIVEEGHPQLKGGSFAVWNDHPGNGITVRDIHHRVMDALPTMAAKTWDGPAVTVPYDEFRTKSAELSEAPGVNLLGRVGEPESVVLEQATVAPGSTLPIKEIGYDYTVEFDLEGAPEEKGTILFSTPDATVWLSDPITGNLGFSREDKLYQFRHDIRPGEKHHYAIVGTNDATKLYVDGKLVDNLDRKLIFHRTGDPKNKESLRYHQMAEMHTLVFPLENVGKFNSALTNLKVSNFATDQK
ncbi:MAG: family 20 glycosylhydrolase [Pseudoflavonifractor sp.]|nr:family 20 glycosylhydrolase [Alloprevotella sp.]MCM1116994.1 family 20 glycosylhydrolase [Pseudoflavonifractor sp.]